MSRDVDILCLLPDVATIGRKKLQAYCDEWLRRPVACEFGCSDLIVGSDLLLTIVVDRKRAEFLGSDHVFLPMDELLGYIIDAHFTDANKRRELHAAERDIRMRLAESGGDYKVSMGRVGLLWLKCKNPACDVSLETTQRAIKGQTINCPPFSVTCPVCGHTDTYDSSDLKVMLKD
jgi:hypothetical protein